MKLLVTTDPELPVPPVLYGGGERAAYHLIMGLVAEGYQIVLIAKKGSKISGSYKLYTWPANRSGGICNIVINALYLLWVIIKEKPAMVLSYSRILYLYPAALFTRKNFIKRYGRPVSNKSTKLADIILGNRIQYVAVARHLTQNLKRRQKWHIVHNYTDTRFFTDNAQQPKEHYLFLGRIEYIKGTHEAVQIAVRMGEKLIIAGNIEPENQEYFNTKVKPWLQSGKIEYVGPVNDAQKRDLLQKSKVLLFPINWEEPFANVIPEALACGTPVFAFKRGCVPEAITNGLNGYAVDSIDEMCEKLKYLDQINREQVRKTAQEGFSVDAAVKKYIAIFNALY